MQGRAAVRPCDIGENTCQMGQEQTRRIGLVVLAGVASLSALIAVLWLLQSYLPEADNYKDLADLVQTALTILALLGGAAFAAYKLELFRDFEPHLTISHAIGHRPIGDGYIHLDVAVVMHNNSKVKVELREGYFLLQQIVPVSEAVDFLGENMLYPPWPVLDQASFSLGDTSIFLEPGQSLQEVLQFMIPRHVESLLIHYLFYDSASLGDRSRGWGITEVYDIIDN